MYRRMTQMLSIFILLITSACAAGGSLAGSGASADPYLIEDFADFEEFRTNTAYWAAGVHVRLEADIDLDPALPDRMTYDAAPIAPTTDPCNLDNHQGTKYAGVFDGDAHLITNMTIKNALPRGSFLALFGALDETGVIKNLSVDNLSITGQGLVSMCAGLCASNYGGSINQCSATGVIDGGNNSIFLAGFCTMMLSGTISQCYADVEINGDYSFASLLAGFVGGVQDGTISHCYAMGSLTTSSTHALVAGFCYGISSSAVSQCYSVCEINALADTSGFAGIVAGSETLVQDCFWDTQATGCDTGYEIDGDSPPAIVAIEGKTTTQMKTPSTFTAAGWDFSDLDGDPADWDMLNDSYPMLTWHDRPMRYSGGLGTETRPYAIATKQDVLNLAAHTFDYNKYFIMTADVSLEDEVFALAVIAPDTDQTNESWEYDGPAFSGHFNGNGHVISDFSIGPNEWHNHFLGLFGAVTGQVENLTINNALIHGWHDSRYFGIMCGLNNGTIENCHALGTVIAGNISIAAGGFCGENLGAINSCSMSGEITGKNNVGGLCGTNYGSILNCDTVGSIYTGDKPPSLYIGGLCGWNEGTISHCCAAVDIESPGGVDYAGGLSGINLGYINDSSAAGSINSAASYCGGLCGYNWEGQIIRSHATGDISGAQFASHLGGVCGDNEGTISRSYAQGSVTGHNIIGGLCGSNWNGIIERCYAGGDVWGAAGSYYVGGLCGWNRSAITSAYATGQIQAESYGGGLCGWNDGQISSCYAAGAVQNLAGTANMGGFCGLQSGVYARMEDSFWNSEVNALLAGYWWDSSEPGTIANVEGRTTKQLMMQETFTTKGWDFVDETTNGTADIWAMCEGTSYPRLLSHILSADIVCPMGVGPEDRMRLLEHWLRIGCQSNPAGVCRNHDFDGNGLINLHDFVALSSYEELQAWSPYWLSESCAVREWCGNADINQDGIVNLEDWRYLLDEWQEGF